MFPDMVELTNLALCVAHCMDSEISSFVHLVRMIG